MKNGIKGALRPGAGKGPGAQQQTHTVHFEQDLRWDRGRAKLATHYRGECVGVGMVAQQ